MNKVFVIIQARMTSSRLPGKVLLPLCGKTVLEVMLDRLSFFRENIIIATTNDGSEKPIIELCEKLNVKFFEGSSSNLLERYFESALKYGVNDDDIIIRLTSDCPLIDENVIKSSLNVLLENNYDFINTGAMSGFPRGFESAIFKFKLLKEAFLNADSLYDLEHVTPYIKRKYEVKLYENIENNSNFRLTLDEEKDYEVIKKIYSNFNNQTNFSYEDLVAYLKENDELMKINSTIAQKGLTMYALEDYFKSQNIFINNHFRDFGYAKDKGESIITYADTIFYFEESLKNKNISVIITKENLKEYIPKDLEKGIVFSDNPRKDFFDLYEKFCKENKFTVNFSFGQGENVNIASSAIISKKSYIGNNCEICENVVIKDNVYIGDNCFIDSGVIIGNDGILYTNEEGNNHFIKHGGSVVIQNNVTILANAVVVKSIFPQVPTIIEPFAIIGIATTIGHESNIGKNSKILGNCVIAKSAIIGENSTVSSSSVIRENINIGKNVNIKAGSIVVNNILDGEIVSGNFAYNHNKHVRNFIKDKK